MISHKKSHSTQLFTRSDFLHHLLNILIVYILICFLSKTNYFPSHLILKHFHIICHCQYTEMIQPYKEKMLMDFYNNTSHLPNQQFVSSQPNAIIYSSCKGFKIKVYSFYIRDTSTNWGVHCSTAML